MGTLERVSPDSRVNSGTVAIRWPAIREKKGFSGCLVVVSAGCQLEADRERGGGVVVPTCHTVAWDVKELGIHSWWRLY